MIRDVSAEPDRSPGFLRLRIEADNLDEPFRFTLSTSDLQALVALLLLSGGDSRLDAPCPEKSELALPF